ncbi:type I-E CRISPR-associated protein Cse1/CasA [Streptomyces parvus]|uniref:type I-E CRISPR-associated protein Cse1/CasA n=1 Tax=Streptomyces parvus TaxID=66428 RepID=UPI002100B29D|nr:type I-E CRISPR-associated protein Cse1/CasA [Streptomyces parvus]MCQ1577190.1 type I-E CRISPR-associated protein Cse1/CasA [Streptomyces parvus]
MAGFDLLTRPWLPVVTDEGPTQASLREALERAHELQLAAPGPEHAALLRLLLAVYAAAVRPTDQEQWDAAWRAPTLGTDRIGAYLDAHADRFNLLSADRPFWQSAHVTEATQDVRGLDVAAWSSGAPQFAQHLLRAPEPMEAADAAVGLVMLQAWHPGGIRTGHPADPATRAGKVYGSKPGPLSTMTHLRITGSCLKNELLLNCPPGPRATGDRPVWERESPTAPMQKREAAGLLDWWTWPTRRVRLFADDAGRVSGIALHDGDRLDSPDQSAARFDPGAALTGRGTRLAICDGAGHLLPWAPTTLLDTSADTGRCAVLDHVTAAAERGSLPPEMRVHTAVLRAEHTTGHRAALSGIIHLTAPVGPASVLADPERRARLVEAARLPWQVQREITHTAADTLGLLTKAVQSRADLSLAPHLTASWEEFTGDPDGEAESWWECLALAARQVAGGKGSGSRALSAARIYVAALSALESNAPATTTAEDLPA